LQLLIYYKMWPHFLSSQNMTDNRVNLSPEYFDICMVSFINEYFTSLLINARYLYSKRRDTKANLHFLKNQYVVV
jgi:hypothetical protein